jgi:mRNA interferase RelE/StbE
MYSVYFTKQADKQFFKLSLDIQRKIENAIDRSKIRPYRYFIMLVDDDLYKLRVGDYRIIAKISGEELIILVVEVGHRKNVYQNK